MNKPFFNGPPPEEFQRQLSEFLRQHFQTNRGGAGPQTEPAGTPEAQENQLKPEEFDFKYKPREVKAYLDRFVIKQDEAKKVLSVALCDHYHHVRLALEGRESPNYAKQNIILIGPTGVGKTYLIRSAADLIGVPFVKADATKFSETGYVGRKRSSPPSRKRPRWPGTTASVWLPKGRFAGAPCTVGSTCSGCLKA